MAKYFFGEPTEAQWKRECEEKNRKWEDDWNKRLRQDAVNGIVSSAMLDIQVLEEEDIDRICNTLKSLKRSTKIN